MRICLVSLDYWPHRSSGLTIYAEDLARGLNERGHTVSVIAAHRSGTPRVATINGVIVYRVALGVTDWIGYSLRAAKVVTQLRRTKEFDIVHFLDVHFAYDY
ncbi:MAG: hypothetical protein EOM24_16035, partial [Chloroflexia bacterium]|nr:hypothetical protein [Chloroflexia bacterium]